MLRSVCNWLMRLSSLDDDAPETFAGNWDAPLYSWPPALALDDPLALNCASRLINEDARLMALDESVAEVALTDEVELELELESY